MSFTSSGKALDGPDFVGRTRGSSECVKVVLQAPGHQEKAVDTREVMVEYGLGYDFGIWTARNGPGLNSCAVVSVHLSAEIMQARCNAERG